MRIARRTLLGAGAALLVPGAGARAATGSADARLRAVLDDLTALPTIAARQARLAAIDEAGLSASARLVLVTVRAGLAVDAEIERAPRGSERRFELLVERQCGERIAATALHERLLGEWHGLADRADRLLARLGFTRGSIGDRFVAMFRDPRWLYPDSSAGRNRAVAEMNARLDRARRRVPVLIGPVPPWCLDVAARRMTLAEEAAKKGGYRILPKPGVAGSYFVDLADIRRRPSWSLGSVVYHELLPGHMIQLPIEAAAEPHPLRLAYAAAFPEGWGVYAEQLMADDGAFDGDEAMLLGHIHWLLFRVGRGLVDTGIHYGRWSRSKALETLRGIQGEPAYFAPFPTDIDRIAREPGNRAAEALVWLRLVDFRKRMTQRGRSTDAMRRFHQMVLADGRKRLDTIDAQIG
jgi:uncharacterized protein (DUF885 family)